MMLRRWPFQNAVVARAGDGDAALLLLLHPVHGRGAVVDFADLMGLAGVVEDPLGGRGLARVDVGHDPEVAVVFDSVEAGHTETGSLKRVKGERCPGEAADMVTRASFSTRRDSRYPSPPYQR